MNFVVTSIWVDDVSLKRTSEKTDSGELFSMRIDTAIEINNEDKSQFRFCLTVYIHQSEKFKFKADQKAVIKFEKPLTEKELEENLTRAEAATILYPHIRAFSLATLQLAGYSNVNMPIVSFK
jgi:preprotein translocase subunit SecB